MEDNNLKNQFSADLLGAVSKVLGKAEQIDEAMDKHFAKQSPKMQDAINLHLRKGKDYAGAVEAAKKHVKEESELEEKRGLWDNIHAKRKRIKSGSGERMRKPGSEGAPSAADLKNSQTEEVSLDEKHGGADYAIYHKSYTDAVDHALSHHAKYGVNASDDDRFHHIGLMSKKPSEGNTTTVNLPAKDHASGKEHTIHMQVYNRGGSHPYELNTYSSKNSTQRQIDRVAAKRKKALGEGTSKGTLEKHFSGNPQLMWTAPTGKSQPAFPDPKSKENKSKSAATKPTQRRGGWKPAFEETIDEKLIGNQAKLDHDGDGKLEKSDFKKLRSKKIAAKMKEAKDCACDDMDEAIYNGHRPTGLPPSRKPQKEKEELFSKLRDFDAKMDAAKKKFATKEEVELDEGRGRPPKSGSAAYIAQQKAKEAGEAEGPEPDEHIMNQVRKAADSGMMPHKVKYADGSTHALQRVHARAVIAKYNRLKPFAKEDMQAEIAKSHEHMMKHAKD